MKSFRHLLRWFAVLLIAGLVSIFWLKDRKDDSHEKRGQVFSQRTPSGLTAESRLKNIPPDAPLPARIEISRLIERSLQRFLASSGADESSTILVELRDRIRATDAQEAAAAIVDFLKSEKDATTHLPFTVGPEGVMAQIPTLRTALLDVLPSLDPTVALEVARRVMDEKKSPDEYALALRNLAWCDIEGDLKNELSDRFEQMIKLTDWSGDPASGFLEAMDAAVEILSARSFDSIVRLGCEALATHNASLVRASFIALDRMVVRDPSLLVNAFVADPGLQGLSSDRRASLLSRLDLTVPSQRDVLVQYLSASDLGSRELDYFADLFPNGNYLHGNWLITSGESTLSIESRLQKDRAVLAEINRLIAENSNEQMNKALVRIRGRLQKLSKK